MALDGMTTGGNLAFQTSMQRATKDAMHRDAMMMRRRSLFVCSPSAQFRVSRLSHFVLLFLLVHSPELIPSVDDVESVFVSQTRVRTDLRLFVSTHHSCYISFGLSHIMIESILLHLTPLAPLAHKLIEDTHNPCDKDHDARVAGRGCTPLP